MKELKELKPGSNVSIRIPVNTSEEILEFINQPRNINRNKYLSNLLFSKIQEEMADKGNTISLTLPFSVSPEQRNIIQDHLKSLFLVMNGGSTKEKEPSEPNKESIDWSELEKVNKLIEFDDDDE